MGKALIALNYRHMQLVGGLLGLLGGLGKATLSRSDNLLGRVKPPFNLSIYWAGSPRSLLV